MDADGKLRILIVVGRFPAISNPFILNQISGLIDLGHDVCIFAMRVDDHENQHSEIGEYKLGERLYVLDKMGSTKWSKIRYVLKGGISLLTRRPMILFRAIKGHVTGEFPLSLKSFSQINTVTRIPETDFDIIHAQFGPQGNMMLMLREICGLGGKLVTQFRGFDVSQLIQSEGIHYYDLLFAHGDMFLPVCDNIKDKVMRLGAPENKTYIQYSGINIDKFKYKKRDYKKTGVLKIGSVGRLTPKKGFEYVIKALSILQAEGFDFTYEIVGDGELEYNLAELVRQCGLGRKVVFLGAKNHDYIANFLHEIDIFISHNVTAISGDPVFSTFHGGIPELINDEVNGFLTEEKDIQQLADKLKKFVFPLQDLENITRSARDMVVEMFDNDRLNRQLVTRYYSLLQQVE
jgi:colanic acid/amylovoran biosynthesis glycosyltransferase